MVLSKLAETFQSKEFALHGYDHGVGRHEGIYGDKARREGEQSTITKS